MYELDFELEDFVDPDNDGFGAVLIVEAHIESISYSGEANGLPYNRTITAPVVTGATLFVTDRDGGELYQLDDVDPETYGVTLDEIKERLENDTL